MRGVFGLANDPPSGRYIERAGGGTTMMLTSLERESSRARFRRIGPNVIVPSREFPIDAPDVPPSSPRPGSGSTERAGRSQSASRSSSTRPKRKCRVLIVEDDTTSLNALKSILTRKGCEVEIAVTLHEGLRLLASRPDY